VSDAPQVVLLPKAWDHASLFELLGAERTQRLGALMLARATAWAMAAFGDRAVSVITGPPLPSGQLIAGAVARAQPGQTLIIVVPELAGWRDDLATALLDDLSAGCPISVAPVFDGGFYLVALAGADPALTALPAEAWSGRTALNTLFAAIGDGGQEVGMLQTERALRHREDVRSALADPLTDEELRTLLG
jgi:hypothetical protein